MKKTLALAGHGLVLASLALGACAPAATPAPTRVPATATSAPPTMAPTMTAEPTMMMPTEAMTMATPEMSMPSTTSGAAELRIALDRLLSEHVVLAAAATGAALDGRTDEFQAAADALDANSVDVSKAIGSVYGADAEAAFLPLWRKHIGFVVDYTNAVAAKDMAKQDQAVADLVAYTEDFGAFLSSANPNLPKDTVAELVKTHVLTLKDVIDAQAAGDPVATYTKLREAFAHMGMIADPLAEAIVMQFPEKFQ